MPSASPISVRGRLVRLPRYHAVGRASVPLAPTQTVAVQETNQRIHQGELPFEAVTCLCGSTEFAEIATTERHGFAQRTVICTACGLVQSNPRMTEEAHHDFYASDEYRRTYDTPDFLRAYERNYTDGRGELVYGFVTSHRPLERLGSVVEFGAGGGWMLRPFAEAGCTVRGYDYSPQLVAMGQSKGIDLVVGGLEAIEGRHDAILAIHVIEHTLDPVGTLATLRRHLAPQGELFVEVPDVERFHMSLLQNAHTYYFSERTLRHYAARAGLVATHLERDRSAAVVRGVFAASDAPAPPVSELAGHFDEMAAMLRRFNWTWPARAPMRAVGRLLGTVGLKEPVNRLLRR